MHISEILAGTPTTVSFEFFPPRSQAASDALYKTISELKPLKPSFVSVTYGAGGSTRKLTRDLVEKIHKESNLTAIPHLTCIGHKKNEIQEILQAYAAAGISNILALAGDPPVDQPNYDRSRDDFRYAADLVSFIKNFKGHPHKKGFGIGVAGFPEGHPLTANRLRELEYLKAKVDQGADYICTQIFFDNRDFYDFCERCEIAGIRVPILAGIMPVTSRSTLMRMADLAAGSRFPASLLKAVNRASDEDAVKRVGIHWATEQCRDLLDKKVKGIHFYTLNKSDATLEIYRNLGIRDSQSL